MTGKKWPKKPSLSKEPVNYARLYFYGFPEKGVVL
jgi:hypothetical protein